MTTIDEFKPIFWSLCKQLRNTDADELTLKAYYRALGTLEPEMIGFAAQRFAKSAEWFPKTSEWRACAARIEKERTDELRDRYRRLKQPMCLACDDTTWKRDAQERVSKCECAERQRLEVLGRRPMPLLAESTNTSTPPTTNVIEEIARVLSVSKSMPNTNPQVEGD